MQVLSSRVRQVRFPYWPSGGESVGSGLTGPYGADPTDPRTSRTPRA